MSPDISAPSSSADSGFDWSSLNGAYADGGGAAFTGVGTGSTSYAYYYGFSNTVPADATINGIRMRADLFYGGAGSCGKRNVTGALSWNSGSSWTTNKTFGSPSSSEATYYTGGSADKWGRTWTVAEVNSSSGFRIRIQGGRGTCIVPGISHNIDFVQREVYYTLPSGFSRLALMGTTMLLLSIATKALSSLCGKFSSNLGAWLFLRHPWHRVNVSTRVLPQACLTDN